MKDAAPQTVHLKDYTPPGYLVDEVHLTFRLHPKKTVVKSRIRFRPNPETESREFRLDGEDLTLLSARIDGEPVNTEVTPEGLTCTVPNGPFTWEAEIEIAPEDNTALEGLYMSNGMYCTQCEAEGFRKITYYPDRPDVMAPFTVRIESDQPVLLSNGDPVAQGEGWAEWHDPWPKPSYLFALVAGDLLAHRDRLTTASGRDVDLAIWVRPGPDEGKCAFGMEALKASMRWDEEVFGLEYDLDVFNIVAVDDFNMGAMENKGLNIFNSALILASPETATDRDYERIEAVIAHEYFHNWTGNRITCRDWFQLSLKEGLTVYRDQQFTGDLRSHAVKRIEDARLMRTHQFREDAGPLAHPVRPESFVEINNFYTITVYEKGAELIGMLRRLIGEDAWRSGMDLYVERHDGQACTVEDWLKAFEDASGRDLNQFKRWYAQAGTPHLTITDTYKDGTYTLDIKQRTPETPGQKVKEPVPIPLALGLLAPDGTELVPTRVVEIDKAEQQVSFEHLHIRPVPSLLRGFSAPVVIERETSAEEQTLLLAYDTDPFTRWEAGHALARDLLARMATGFGGANAAFLDGLGAVLRDDGLDPAFRALVLTLPSEDEIAQHLYETGTVPDPLAIRVAREALQVQIAEALREPMVRVRAAMGVPGPYSPDAESAGKRALGNAILAYVSHIDGGAAAKAQFDSADNMTQSVAALTTLLTIGEGKHALEVFEDKWKADRLVMDKWFSLQVLCAPPEGTAATAEALTKHPAFDERNPNRFRSVFGALAGNPAGFHHPSGAGYRLLADWLIRLDRLNPQTAARMSAAFQTWRRYGPDRQALILAELDRIAGTEGLSRDTGEMVTRMRAG